MFPNSHVLRTLIYLKGEKKVLYVPSYFKGKHFKSAHEITLFIDAVLYKYSTEIAPNNVVALQLSFLQKWTYTWNDII